MARCHLSGTVQDRYGNAVSGASVTVYEPGTTTPVSATLYLASTGLDELANPLTTDANGEFGFWLDTTQYVDLYISGASVTARTEAGVYSSGFGVIVVARPFSSAGGLTTAYATAAEYRSHVGKSDTASDTEILEQLTGVSRYLDRRLRRFFGQDATPVARVYDGNGRTRLWLPDDVASSTGLVLVADLNGDYTAETTLTLNTDFWLGPENADKEPEPHPWEWIEVHPMSALVSAWPRQRRAIELTAKFGWPAVPGAIKEATISITRQLRDAHIAGAATTVEAIDQAIGFNQQLADVKSLIFRLQTMYAKPPRT